MQRAYGAVTLAVSVPLFLLMLLRARGRARLLERYGCWNLELPECIWFHGSSMGEINGLLPVIKKLKAQKPDLPVLVSATSVTGLEKAQGVATHLRLLPLDSGIWLRRALKGIKPSAFVFSETELWPALTEYLHGRGVPMYLVNARISDHSWENYRRMRMLIAPLLKRMSAILVSSQLSAGRFIELGADPSLVEIAGNSKYDTRPAVQSAAQAAALKRAFFRENLPVLVLGSLRPGEEDFWFPAIRAALDQGCAFRVAVAPRHQEKFDYFAARLEKSGLQFDRWSVFKQAAQQGTPLPASDKPVVLLDTLGDLNAVYSIADLAFVGATLVDIGGHNPLEPAAYGACVALGPYVRNVPDVVTAMRENDALIQITNAGEIADLLKRLAAGDAGLKETGQRGKLVWQSFAGATEKILKRIGAQ